MWAAFNLKAWIEEHRDLLRPPVGNAQLWHDSEFTVMVVGGPNARKDYHVDPSEEFFYQVEGDIVVKIVDQGVHRDIPIREGEIFLLSALTPHSPRRPAGTVGLVIERTRRTDEGEAFEWYCEGCGRLLYREELIVSDIVAQLPVIFERYWEGPVARRTCQACGQIMVRPGESAEKRP